MGSLLDQLAERLGIALRYEGLDGRFHEVPDATKLAILEAMGVAAGSGEQLRAQLESLPEPPPADPELAAGTRCYLPQRPARCWGIALQLYAIRSGRNWGIGDFGDLADFTGIAAAADADFVGINPLHAGFLADPDRRSPFSPSNRRFLNPLYIAVDRVPGFTESMVDRQRLEAARATPLVDYAAVTRLKLSALRALWPAWQASGELPADWTHRAFARFREELGEPLRRHALFEAISLHMVETGSGGAGWEDWPHDFRSATSAAVTGFAEQHADAVAFQQWLQWLASVQLQAAGEAARSAGMQIGLYLDFAVGEAPDGSATWGAPESMMRRVHIGAPPDYFSTNGQDWALAPLSPTAIGSDSTWYRDLLGTSMRYAGALRLDHVMGIQHLFLVPEGQSPAAGTYVRFPLGRLLADIVEMSHRYRTVVVGEDLGNVPRGFRDVMAAAAILSYRILYFERHGDAFAPPALYPTDALACLSTHDLPTFEGWWRGDDVRLRHEHDLIDAAAMDEQLAQRNLDRNQLCGMLQQAGLLDESTAAAALAAAIDDALALPESLLVAIHRHLARAPSRLLAVRIEDLCGEREPVNLPGTVDSYPNWKRKLALPIEDIAAEPLYAAVTAALAMERPKEE